MTDGGGYDNSSVGRPGEDEAGKKGATAEEEKEEEEVEGGAHGATKREGTQAWRERREVSRRKTKRRRRALGREEDVCPLAMIIAESHRTWKDRKNDSPSAVSRSR